MCFYVTQTVSHIPRYRIYTPVLHMSTKAHEQILYETDFSALHGVSNIPEHYMVFITSYLLKEKLVTMNVRWTDRCSIYDLAF